MKINLWISGAINALKWPTALAALLALPSLALAFAWSALHPLSRIEQHIFLLLGFGAYLGAWLLFIRKWRASWFSTLEHEITHAIFAWMSFCRVTGIRATWKSGGQCSYVGKTNWLIKTTPYFFPTLCAVVLLVHLFFPLSDQVLQLALGITMAYHITSTYQETHRKQTDLKEAGFSFCFLFLPSANLLVYGWLLSWLNPLSDWPEPLFQHLDWAIQQLFQWK